MITALKVAGLLFAAAIVQVSVIASVDVLGGTPDLLLVTLIAVALGRGSITGAAGGFLAGLVVDTATLGTLGVTSLLLTLAGYWAGRYGETTGRDRPHAPIAAVLVITLLVGVGGYALEFMLGEDVSAQHALLETLLPTLGLNLLIAVPVLWLVRVVLGPAPAPPARGQEVEVVV